MGRRRQEPKELDTGRVSLAMRARRTDGGLFPFLPSPRRRIAVALVLATVLAGVALLLLVILR